MTSLLLIKHLFIYYCYGGSWCILYVVLCFFCQATSPVFVVYVYSLVVCFLRLALCVLAIKSDTLPLGRIFSKRRKIRILDRIDRYLCNI